MPKPSMIRSWLLRLGRLAVLAFPLLLVLRWGGKGAWTLQVAGIIAVVGALAVILAMPQRLRLPPWGWLLSLLLPYALFSAFQALPIGLIHPLVAPDVVALDVETAAWALDRDAALESTAWCLALLAWGLSAAVVLRRVSPLRLAGWVVLFAAGHALLALLLAAVAPAFPYDNGYAGRVRGSFTYPNHAAAFWLMSLPLALLWARRLALAGRPHAWLAPAVLLSAIVLSASRSGTILALLLGLPLLWTVLPRRHRALWALSVVGLVLCGLWLMNLDEAARRFEALDGSQGANLNGRLILWGAALPLIRAAGPVGLGSDAARLVWRRSGEGSFEPSNVHELHNDLLELLLTHGWLGALLVLGGSALAAWQLWKAHGRRHGHIRQGATLGLLALGGYALVDFPWQSEALVAWALVLALVLALTHRDRRQRQVCGSARLRCCCGLAALVLVGLAPLDWRQERESVLAWWAERMAAERRLNGSPVHSAEAVVAALTAEPRGARLAVVQARLALDLAVEDPAMLERAERALATAGAAAPADGAAWVERLRLARLQGRSADAAMAQARLAVWAPSWPYAQQQALLAVQAGLLPEVQSRALAWSILSRDQGQPAWVFPVLETVLGREQLATALIDRRSVPRLAASARTWMAESATLEQWQRSWRDWYRESHAHVVPEQWSVVEALGIEPSRIARALHLPRGDQALARLTRSLNRAGLPLPPALTAALSGAPPAALALLEPVPKDATAVATALAALEPWTSQAWINRRHSELDALGLALAGDPSRLDASTPPDHLAAALERTRDPTQRRHLEGLIGRCRRPRWQDLRGGVWAWWLVDAHSPPLAVELTTWTALLVDGEFHAWLRGSIDLRVRVPTGLHRIALIAPPR